MKISTANSETVNSLGKAHIHIEINGIIYHHIMEVLPNLPNNIDCVLGSDFMSKYEVKLEFRNDCLLFKCGCEKPLNITLCGQHRFAMAYAYETDNDYGNEINFQNDIKNINQTIVLNVSMPVILKAQTTIQVPALCVGMEHYEGAYILEGTMLTNKHPALIMPGEIVDVCQGECMIRVYNLNNMDILLHKNLPLALASPVDYVPIEEYKINEGMNTPNALVMVLQATLWMAGKAK